MVAKGVGADNLNSDLPLVNIGDELALLYEFLIDVGVRGGQKLYFLRMKENK